VFVSAVSRELKSARQLVANTLTFLGHQPVWQEIFGTESGDLRAALRQQIDHCHGVVQLVGHCYGAEPSTPDEEFGRVSYTQYEALYARKCDKKVWYFFIDDHFPADPCDNEPQELRDLQTAYRRTLQSDTHVFHPLRSSEGLEASVLKLRDDLTRLRRGVKQWAIAAGALLVITVVLGIWALHRQERTSQQLVAMQTKMDELLRKAVREFPEVEAEATEDETAEHVSAPTKARIPSGNVVSQTVQVQSTEDQREIEERVYTELGRKLGLDPKVLHEKLPAFAAKLKSAPNATSLDRADAAYVVKDYVESERLALQGSDDARKSPEPEDDIEALKLAGLAAQKHDEDAHAMEHFRDAEKLTDRERDPGEWAEVQNAIANVLIDQGEPGAAEKVFRDVVGVMSRVLGAEHPDTLRSRSSLAIALNAQGKYAEAETELCDVIQVEEKILGAENANTLNSRDTFAGVLYGEGRHAEAEAEYRDVVRLREKLLGPEHPRHSR
jgi:tetratricopeptide (TPR) repeat protein